MGDLSALTDFSGAMSWLDGQLVRRAMTIVIGLSIIYVLRMIAARALKRTIKDPTTSYYLQKVVKVAAWVVGAIFVANVFSDRLGNITVALGVAGAGIAFALQEVIASVAGWVAITVTGYYRTGDRVQLGGIVGDVIDVGVLRTTLMECGQWVKADIYTGRIVRVANSFVFKEPVFNYSGDFPFLWDEITVPVKFGSDHHLARKLLQEAVDAVTGDYSKNAKKTWASLVDKYRLEDVKIDPLVTMVFNDNWIEFTVRFVVDYQKRRTTKDALFSSILDEFNKHPTKLGLASATFHLVEAPTINVRIQPST